MKTSTIRFIDEKASGVCQYDGSTWVICSAVAIRLPSWYPIPKIHQYNNTFIQNVIDTDQKGYDSWLMDFIPNAVYMKSRKNISLMINSQYSVQAKYIRLFDWRTDALFRMNTKTGLIYVYESVTGILIGLILPVKRREAENEENNK